MCTAFKRKCKLHLLLSTGINRNYHDFDQDLLFCYDFKRRRRIRIIIFIYLL